MAEKGQGGKQEIDALAVLKLLTSGLRASNLNIQFGILAIASTVVIFFGSWVTGNAPKPCAVARGCPDLLPETGHDVPFLRESVLILTSLFVLEFCQVLVSWCHGHGCYSELVGPSELMPTLLMCCVFLVLALTHLFYLKGWDLRHAMPPLTLENTIHPTEAWRPVLTLRMFEWHINVPMLLFLIGCGLFQRPVSEVFPAVFSTVTYLTLSWLACLVEGLVLRWALVAVSFYGWLIASLDMHQWVVSSRCLALPVRPLRLCLVYFHAVMYGIYGVVYLAAMVNYISPLLENMCYMYMDLFVKVFTSVIIAMVHKGDVRDALKRMSAKTVEANVLMSSLLRASCSCVLSCDITSIGECKVAEEQLAEEVRWLQQILDGEIIGEDFADCIAGSDNKEQFKSYVRNVWLQANSLSGQQTQAIQAETSAQILKASHTAPLAQMLHSQLKTVDAPSKLPVTILISIPVRQHFDADSLQSNLTALLGLRMAENTERRRGPESQLPEELLMDSVSQISIRDDHQMLALASAAGGASPLALERPAIGDVNARLVQALSSSIEDDIPNLSWAQVRLACEQLGRALARHRNQPLQESDSLKQELLLVAQQIQTMCHQDMDMPDHFVNSVAESIRKGLCGLEVHSSGADTLVSDAAVNLVLSIQAGLMQRRRLAPRTPAAHEDQRVETIAEVPSTLDGTASSEHSRDSDS